MEAGRLKFTERKVAALVVGTLVNILQNAFAEPMTTGKQKRVPLIEGQVRTPEPPTDPQRSGLVDERCQTRQRVPPRQLTM